MFSRSFIERILLMFIGSYLTYYIAIQIMKESIAEPDYDIKYTGKLSLNTHEKVIYNSVLSSDKIDIDFSNIVGLDSAKNALTKLVINPLQSSKSKNVPNGIILHGVPGTGKTMLVKALCKELNVNFICFEQNYIEQKMFGESAKMVKALFTLAEKLKPCVIFIDEIDGMFGERNAFDQYFVTNIKTQMLMQMDGIMSRDPSIIFIGTTNRLHSLDNALKRRMRTHIEVKLPTYSEIIEMYNYYLKDEDVSCIDFDEIATMSTCFSGCDISEICKISLNMCDNESLHTEDILNVINDFM